MYTFHTMYTHTKLWKTLKTLWCIMFLMIRQIKHIAVHHSGGTASDSYASTQNLKFTDIENYHKQKWNFLSSLGFFTGYNIVIDKDGNWEQARAFGEETAAQVGHNFDTISFCLIGNFSKDTHGKPVDTPTESQVKTFVYLADLIIDGKLAIFHVASGTVINVGVSDIHPHRYYEPTTACYGTLLDDMWAQNQVIEYRSFFPALIKIVFSVLAVVKDLVSYNASAKKAGALTNNNCI